MASTLTRLAGFRSRHRSARQAMFPRSIKAQPPNTSQTIVVVSVITFACGCISAPFTHMLLSHYAMHKGVTASTKHHLSSHMQIGCSNSLCLWNADVSSVRHESTLDAVSAAPTWFDYQYIWATKSALASAANVDPEDFSTPSGEFFRAEVLTKAALSLCVVFLRIPSMRTVMKIYCTPSLD